MANLNAQKALVPAPMRVDGTAVMVLDKYVLTATNPAAADVIRFRLPGGIRLGRLKFVFDDLDTNTTLVFGVGYTPVDSSSSLAANATYFAAAGQTTAQAGGALECTFKPIKFEEDVFVTLTIGTGGAGTNTGDEIHMIAEGVSEGIK